MIWHNSKVTALYHHKTSDEDYPCKVRITDTEILVEYEAGDGFVQYIGKNDGTGHFKLTSSDVKGRATLHQFPGDDRLEGNWVEGGIRGMWIIDLIE